MIYRFKQQIERTLILINAEASEESLFWDMLIYLGFINLQVLQSSKSLIPSLILSKELINLLTMLRVQSIELDVILV